METIEIISVIGIALIAFIQSYRVIKLRKQLFSVEKSFKDACEDICRLKSYAGAPKRLTIKFDTEGKDLKAVLKRTNA
jgi:hypothetical protein